ncbi:MAG TPA: 50S ribosomal protein L11 methyltransferase, partial [Gammaproteobacteria bacterium]|nr:50S ribosomal protein L11 methyltransferase [Gammaproteobacteria bacterium]
MPWFQARFTTQQPFAENFSDLLMELGAASVTFEDAEDQPLLEPPPGETPLWELINVVGLFDAELNQQEIRQQLLRQLPEDNATTLRFVPLEEQDWVRAWMDDFHPMQFGQRLWIIPSWSEPVDPEGVNILLDPGLAFGTGTHSTTALCLEWLDAHPPTGQKVIDYGCGSGILAIAAAKLGASQIDGVDNDPQALIATHDNAEKNRVTHIQGFLPDTFPKEQQADLLLANILAGPLEELAPTFASHVVAGGSI